MGYTSKYKLKIFVQKMKTERDRKGQTETDTDRKTSFRGNWGGDGMFDRQIITWVFVKFKLFNQLKFIWVS